MADPSRTPSVGDGLDGLKRVGLPASAHQRLSEKPGTIHFEDLRRAPHVYLLPEYGDADSEREILDDCWPDLFAAMLNCWLTDEQQWPKNRTHQMFGEWFDLQMCPVVEDLHVDEELVELD